MPPQKRCLLWDYTNTRDIPTALDKLPFSSSNPIISLHNWNTWTPPELKDRLQFRPMVRDLSCITGQDWQNITSSTAEIIHFFNEPERQGISAEKAAEIWKENMIGLRKEGGKKLVSPSCANDEGGQKWINEFLDLVEDEMPDFLGLHYYGTDVRHAIEFLESTHEKYSALPVVVSEIACISRERDEVVKFMEEMMAYMDGKEWIFEYGWFGCMRHCADDFVSPAAQLMDKNGEFTELMNLLTGKEGDGCDS